MLDIFFHNFFKSFIFKSRESQIFVSIGMFEQTEKFKNNILCIHFYVLPTKAIHNVSEGLIIQNNFIISLVKYYDLSGCNILKGNQ